MILDNKTATKPKEKNKASTTKKTKKSDSKVNFLNIKRAFAVTLFLVSTYVLIALVSHLFNWQNDQVFKELQLFNDPESDVRAMNLCGPMGAYLGNLLIGKYFGIVGVLLPLPFISIAIYLFNLKFRFLLKLSISTFSGLMILPTTITLLTPFADQTIFGSGWGGGYGLYLYNLLIMSIGIVGCIISVLIFASFWLIYTFPYSYRWYVGLSHKIKKSANKIGDKINDSTVPDYSEKEEKQKTDLQSDNIDEKDNISDFEKTDDADLLGVEVDNADSEPENQIKIETDNNEIQVRINNTDEDFEQNSLQNSQTEETSYEQVIQNSFDDVASSENDTDSKDVKITVTDNAILEGVAEAQIGVNELDTIDDDEFEQSVFDPTKELSNFKLPSLSLLNNTVAKIKVTKEEIQANTKRIVDTLSNFNIKIDDIVATIGPTVTLYEIKPSAGVRISTIKRLEDDIALSLAALGIRIIAPIPGKDTVGIEVPNKDKEIVSMYSVVTSTEFQNSDAELPIVLGKTIQNRAYVVDLAKMPHLLVAGATGQGKSVGLNAIITSLLYKKHPSELKFVMVDPKKVEFSLYSAIERHYLAKLPDEDEAIIVDNQKVINTLNSLCIEMDARYDLLKKAKVRNIKEYNSKFKDRKLNPRNGHKFLPYFVVIIDEFGDLILTAGKEVETPLTRLAALARAVGIHLVIATQRPTTNIITGTIKANFPARMAFKVMSGIDSKTILDSTGASQLIGKGDMLILSNNDLTRVQCAFIDTPEVEKITDYIGSQVGFGCAFALPEYTAEVNEVDSGFKTVAQRDALFDKVARYVVTNQIGSASTIQRNFEIGFNRAGRIMDQLEKAGIVGKQQGSKPRQVMISDLTQLELHLINIDNPPYNA